MPPGLRPVFRCPLGVTCPHLLDVVGDKREMLFDQRQVGDQAANQRRHDQTADKSKPCAECQVLASGSGDPVTGLGAAADNDRRQRRIDRFQQFGEGPRKPHGKLRC